MAADERAGELQNPPLQSATRSQYSRERNRYRHAEVRSTTQRTFGPARSRVWVARRATPALIA